jgi:chromosome segregation protein
VDKAADKAADKVWIRRQIRCREGEEMYLKRLEVDKFKSFGKKQVIPFLKGFTAITGPNGSGKSNICDAIMFVLGPKSSKTVRAEKLTDLIYDGGKTKQPANYCEVSLVFDNTDREIPINREEVILTRYVKRSPKPAEPDGYYSYFYINGKSASMGDFNNLLQAARINGYNIVQQGTITRIAEMTLTERRKIIDDLAGITQFDREIEHSEMEKEKVEDNLKKVKIILRTIEDQIKQLKEERDQALQFKQIQDELANTKKKLVIKQKIDMENRLENIEAEINSYEAEIAETERTEKALKNERERVRDKLTEIDEKIRTSTEAQEISDKIKSVEADKIRTEEKLNFIKREKAQLLDELKDLEEEFNQVSKECAERSRETKRVEEELNRKKSNLENLKRNLDSIKKKIEEIANSERSIAGDLLELKQRWEQREEEKYKLELELQGTNQRYQEEKSEVEGISKELEKYETELNEKEWKIKNVKKELDQKLKERSDLFNEIERKQSDLSHTREELKRVERKIPELKQKAERYKERTQEGGEYSRSISEILKLKGEIPGIIGPVLELIDFDEKYTKAIQAAGGSRLFAVVVKDDDIGAKCIEHLKRGEFGRAVFLPLNKIKKSTVGANALLKLRSDMVLGLLKDFVKTEKELEGMLWWVFGDTLLTRSLDDARKIMGGARLVTAEGELIEASGAMVGGSLPVYPKIRKVEFGKDPVRELEDAQQRKVELEQKEVGFEREIKEIEERLGKQSQLSETQYSDMEFEREKLKGRVKQLRTKKEERSRILQDYRNKIESTSSRLSEIKKELEEINRQRDEKGRILAREKPEIQKKIEEETAGLNALQVEISQLETDCKLANQQLMITKSNREEIESRMGKERKEDEKLSREIKELTEKHQMLEHAYTDLLETNAAFREEFKKLNDEKQTLRERELELDRKAEELQLKVSTANQNLATAKSKRETVAENLSKIKEEVEEYDDEFRKEAQQEKMGDLEFKQRMLEENISGFGPVNMKALTQWDEQKEKERLHQEEIDKLKEQKKELQKLVNETKRKKKETFLGVFDSLNKQYMGVYSDLSGGGDGELELEDPGNPFNGGLTMKARPKGKKAKRLHALSGGEKSLASLSLIFAIQQYKPSPFYVLDEADMFLDDVNAGGVARMIKKSSNSAQWITISLHEAMLKSADHIYGVTMQELETSNIVGGVNLAN